ncbi:MAG TPA: hypothetical protein VE008_07310 [Burkholderiales bacterium]|nr:hypothetical protein [Burkholderiales bacterium]
MFTPPKQPAAEEYFGFDFVRQLAVGEAILSAVCTLVVVDGAGDPNPGAMLSGAPVISGTKVSQKIIGGVGGTRYCFTILATTDGPEKIPLSDTFWVQAPCSQLT